MSELRDLAIEYGRLWERFIQIVEKKKELEKRVAHLESLVDEVTSKDSIEKMKKHEWYNENN